VHSANLPRKLDEERTIAHLREERRRLREEERNLTRKAAWEWFKRKELRELELRKDGQLVELLKEVHQSLSVLS
jgi:hypothetical protein